MVSRMLELGEQPYTEADAEWDAFVAAHPHGSLLPVSYTHLDVYKRQR